MEFSVIAKNIEYFNTIVGLIFEQLYESFPVKVDINEEAIARALNVEVIDNTPQDWAAPRIINFGMLDDKLNFRHMLWSSAEWLRDEGFIRFADDHQMNEVVLTDRALTALNSTPAALKQSFGTKLGSLVKDAGSEAGRSAISEVVGQIIGATARSLMT